MERIFLAFICLAVVDAQISPWSNVPIGVKPVSYFFRVIDQYCIFVANPCKTFPKINFGIIYMCKSNEICDETRNIFFEHAYQTWFFSLFV